MIQVLSFPEELIQETGQTPSICLVLPFEPQINDKSSIEFRLKKMMQKAESRLLQQYSNRKALPVLARIQQLVSEISYHNYKKSIALLATPYRSKVFYLDFPVTETICTGEDLDVRNVIKAQCNTPHYLVLVLGNQLAKLYEGYANRMALMKYNMQSANSFLRQVDTGLGLVLDAYRLPVFVVGEKIMLEAFRKETVHAEHIMTYLTADLDFATEKEILAVLRPELAQWHRHQYQLLIQKLNKARQEGPIHCGVDQVWAAATHRRSLLLAVEENLMHLVPENRDVAIREEWQIGPIYDPMQLDLVTDAIEKVLKDGGEVMLVPAGSLAAFQQIALIEAHHEYASMPVPEQLERH